MCSSPLLLFISLKCIFFLLLNAVDISNCNFIPFHLCQIEFYNERGLSASYAYLEAVLRLLVPAAARLLGNKSGDTRVVVASALRRMLPPALHATLLVSNSISKCLVVCSAGGSMVTERLWRMLLSATVSTVYQWYLRM